MNNPATESGEREGHAVEGPRPRQARFDALGILHNVMLWGIEKRGFVTDVDGPEEFVARMGAATGDPGTAILAWALLPTLAHLLLRSGPAELPKCIPKQPAYSA